MILVVLFECFVTVFYTLSTMILSFDMQARAQKVIYVRMVSIEVTYPRDKQLFVRYNVNVPLSLLAQAIIYVTLMSSAMNLF